MANASEELNLAKNQGQDGTGDQKQGGGLKKWIFIVVGVLLLAGGGGAAYFMLGSDSGPEAAAGGEAASAEAPAEVEEDPIYLALSPGFIVNFEDAGTTRYLQVELQVMSYDQAVIDKVEANIPAVRNDLILLLSDQDYQLLNTVEGKEGLRKQVLESINKAIRAKGTAQVNDVFFTGFVMQ